MKLGSLGTRISRWLLIVLVACGGTLFAPLSGCDADVQAVILGGFQDLSNVLVDAFFLSIASDETTTTTTTTKAVSQPPDTWLL